jgi:hypothetical protein
MTFTNSESTSATSSFTVDGSIAMTDGNGSFPDGTYVITSGGIYVGDHTLTFGNGSFKIVGGIDINQGGGTLTFGSALNANSVFQVPNAGSSGYAINTSTSSTLTIGSFTYVDLNGNVQIEGAATLGAGSYTINGFFSANSAGGGDFTALGVSIVASGQITFGQGYADIKLTAPATITTATLGTSPTIALATESTSTTTFTGGTSSTELVGAIYTPRSALSMINDGVISSNGSCSIVVASSINLSSSGSITSTCDGVTSTTLSVVSLVK